RAHLLLPGALQRWPVGDRAGPGDQRLLPAAHRRLGGRTHPGARRRQGSWPDLSGSRRSSADGELTTAQGRPGLRPGRPCLYSVGQCAGAPERCAAARMVTASTTRPIPITIMYQPRNSTNVAIPTAGWTATTTPKTSIATPAATPQPQPGNPRPRRQETASTIPPMSAQIAAINTRVEAACRGWMIKKMPASAPITPKAISQPAP